MSETLEIPQLTKEIRYPSFQTTLREITSSRVDVAAINKIENTLDPQQYAETAPNTTLDDTLNWLTHGMTRRFDSIHLGSKKRIAVGVEQGQSAPVESIIIATKPVNETGELSGYTYLYRSEDFSKLPENLQQKHAAATKLDLSYVTATKDQNYNLTEVSESLMQTAMMLLKKSIGEELNGELTPEQLSEAQKKLALFANSNSSESEANYHKALDMAGFKEIHRYDEKGDNYIVYTLSPADLAETFKQRQARTSF